MSSWKVCPRIGRLSSCRWTQTWLGSSFRLVLSSDAQRLPPTNRCLSRGSPRCSASACSAEWGVWTSGWRRVEPQQPFNKQCGGVLSWLNFPTESQELTFVFASRPFSVRICPSRNGRASSLANYPHCWRQPNQARAERRELLHLVISKLKRRQGPVRDACVVPMGRGPATWLQAPTTQRDEIRVQVGCSRMGPLFGSRPCTLERCWGRGLLASILLGTSLRPLPRELAVSLQFQGQLGQANLQIQSRLPSASKSLGKWARFLGW